MGRLGELSGDPDLLPVVAPNPQDLLQKIQCQDELVLKLRAQHFVLNPEFIQLLLPVWRIFSSFEDVIDDVRRCRHTISEEGKDLIDLMETGFIITFLIKWIRIRRNPTVPAKRIKLGVQLEYHRSRLLPRMRRLLDKINKRYKEVLRENQLMVEHPLLYAQSPFFNAQVNRNVYQRYLLVNLKEIARHWKREETFSEKSFLLWSRYKKYGVLSCMLYLKVSTNTLYLMYILFCVYLLWHYWS